MGDTSTTVEQYYRDAFEQTAAGVAIHEPGSDQFVEVNRAYADAMGHDPESLEGRSLGDLAAADDADLAASVDRALAEGSERVDEVVTDADGGRRAVTLELDAVGDGPDRRLVSTIRSVEQSADAVARIQRRHEAALAATGTGVWEWDIATDEVVWTESMERVFGIDPGTFPGTFEAFAEMVHGDDLADVETAIADAIENDELFQSEYRIHRADGEQRWVAARGELHDTDYDDGRFVGIVTDVTDRKRKERAIEERERQYRHLVERFPDPHYTVDQDWRVTYCNQALADRLGMDPEDIEGSLVWDLIPDGEGAALERRFRRVMETGEPDDFEYQHSSGELVRIQAYPYEDGIAAVSTDISDQRRALESVVGATPIVLFRLDADGVFQEMRGEVLSRLDIDPEDLIGESIFDAYADNGDVVAAARRALDGEEFRFTLTLDGIALETQFRPIFSDGEVDGVIGVSMDVTDLHRQRERMEFFNSILRHDVLNGMTVIKMRAELLADQLEGDQERYAQTILDWCNTTTGVTKRVRRVIETLATPEEDHRLEPVDVSAILTRRTRELSTAYPEVEFETDVPAGIRAWADELLADVVGNLLSNSIEHNDTDDLRIQASVEETADTVRIVIADDGPGIDANRRESVFRRGETSQAKESGSGFGLFFVDVMVEKYGGEVRIEESEDGGARFVVELTPVEAAQ